MACVRKRLLEVLCTIRRPFQEGTHHIGAQPEVAVVVDWQHCAPSISMAVRITTAVVAQPTKVRCPLMSHPDDKASPRSRALYIYQATATTPVKSPTMRQAPQRSNFNHRKSSADQLLADQTCYQRPRASREYEHSYRKKARPSTAT